MNYDELIAKLEVATEGSRELDAAIAVAVGLYRVRHTYDETIVDRADEPGLRFTADNQKHWVYSSECPAFTTSLDAALTLLPDGAEYSISNIYGIATVEMPLNGGEIVPEIAQRKDVNVILAFVTAALKARQASA